MSTFLDRGEAMRLKAQASALLEKACALPAGQSSSVGSLLDSGTDTFLFLVKGGRDSWMKPARAAHKALEALANLELALVAFEQGQKLEAVQTAPKGNPPPLAPSVDASSPQEAAGSLAGSSADTFGKLPLATLTPLSKSKARPGHQRDDRLTDLKQRLASSSLPWENLSPQVAWDITFGEAWNSAPVLYLRLVYYLLMRLFLVTIPKAVMIVTLAAGLSILLSMLFAPNLFARGLLGVLRWIPLALYSCAEEIMKEVGLSHFQPLGHCPAHCGPGAFDQKVADVVTAVVGPASPAPSPAGVPAVLPQSPTAWVPLYATLFTIIVWRQGPLVR